MTENDALAFYDMIQNRIFGWDIALATDPATGRVDGRTRRSKEAAELQRDIIIAGPRFDTAMRCLMSDGDLAALWPTELQAVARFRIDHKVPREINEPTSEVSIAERAQLENDPYPDWVIQHGKPATVEDHPPIPPRSEAYRAWKRDRDAGMSTAEIIARSQAREDAIEKGTQP